MVVQNEWEREKYFFEICYPRNFIGIKIGLFCFFLENLVFFVTEKMIHNHHFVKVCYHNHHNLIVPDIYKILLLPI